MFYTLFKKISNVGVSKRYSIQDKRSIRLTNQTCMIGIFTSAIASVCHILFNGFSAISILAPIIVSLFAITLWLNYKGKHSFAKKYLIGVALLILSVVNALVDANSFFFYYFLLTFTFSIILFSNAKTRLISFSLHLIAIILSTSFAFYQEIPLLEVPNTLAFGIINMFLIMLILYAFLRGIVSENRKFEKRFIQLVKSISEKNKQLNIAQVQAEDKAQALNTSNLSLQTEVKERKKIETALRLSNEELQQFAYVASHDLKEPLRTISSFIGLLERKMKDKLDDTTTEYFDFIVDGAQRMSVLLDNLLAYARLNNEITFERTNLNNTLELTQYNLKNLTDRKDALLVFQKMPILMVCRPQINQVFQNLISNALKFNTNEKPTVEIKYSETKHEYTFSVEDNGIGIAQEYQDKIFIIFNRLHDRNSYEGTGIGLAICKKIIENHEGRIWLHSIPNVGSTFYFSISKSLKNSSADVRELQEASKRIVRQN